MVTANLVALAVLVVSLTEASTAAGSVLLATIQDWATNVISFAAALGTGPRRSVTRREARRNEPPHSDGRFAQDENDDALTEVAAGSSKQPGCIPTSVDYRYLSR